MDLDKKCVIRCRLPVWMYRSNFVDWGFAKRSILLLKIMYLEIFASGTTRIIIILEYLDNCNKKKRFQEKSKFREFKRKTITILKFLPDNLNFHDETNIYPFIFCTMKENNVSSFTWQAVYSSRYQTTRKKKREKKRKKRRMNFPQDERLQTLIVWFDKMSKYEFAQLLALRIIAIVKADYEALSAIILSFLIGHPC